MRRGLLIAPETLSITSDTSCGPNRAEGVDALRGTSGAKHTDMALSIQTSAAARSATPAAPRWTAPSRGEWAQSLDGRKSDPVNLYLHGSLEDVKKTFLKAGWVLPMKNTTQSKLAYAGASLFEKTLGKVWEPKAVKDTVAAMPIAHLKYQGKPDVLSFEKDNDPTGGRHHFRVFDTGKVDAKGEKVWAVAASLDDATHFSPTNTKQWFITHSVDPNADKERDEIMRSLSKTKGIASMKTLKPPFGAPAPSGLHSRDGRVFELWLKRP